MEKIQDRKYAGNSTHVFIAVLTLLSELILSCVVTAQGTVQLRAIGPNCTKHDDQHYTRTVIFQIEHMASLCLLSYSESAPNDCCWPLNRQRIPRR